MCQSLCACQPAIHEACSLCEAGSPAGTPWCPHPMPLPVSSMAGLEVLKPCCLPCLIGRTLWGSWPGLCLGRAHGAGTRLEQQGHIQSSLMTWEEAGGHGRAPVRIGGARLPQGKDTGMQLAPRQAACPAAPPLEALMAGAPPEGLQGQLGAGSTGCPDFLHQSLAGAGAALACVCPASIMGFLQPWVQMFPLFWAGPTQGVSHPPAGSVCRVEQSPAPGPGCGGHCPLCSLSQDPLPRLARGLVLGSELARPWETAPLNWDPELSCVSSPCHTRGQGPGQGVGGRRAGRGTRLPAVLPS